MNDINLNALLQEGMNLRNELLEGPKEVEAPRKKKSALKKYFPYGKKNFPNNVFLNTNYTSNTENNYNVNNRQNQEIKKINGINRAFVQNERDTYLLPVNHFEQAAIKRTSLHIRTYITKLWSEIYPERMGDISYDMIDPIVTTYEMIRKFKSKNNHHGFKGMNNKIILGMIVYYDLLCRRDALPIPIPVFVHLLNNVQTMSFKQAVSIKQFHKYEEMGRGKIKRIFFTRQCKDKMDPEVHHYFPFLYKLYKFTEDDKRLTMSLTKRLKRVNFETNVTNGLLAMCIIKAIGKVSKNVNIDISKYGFQSVGIKKSYPLILNTFQYYVAIESGNQKNITANIRNVGQSSKTKGNTNTEQSSKTKDKRKQTQFYLKPENKGKTKVQSKQSSSSSSGLSSNGNNIAARAFNSNN